MAQVNFFSEALLGVRIWLLGAAYTFRAHWMRLLSSAVGLAIAVSALMGVGLAGTAAIRAFDQSISIGKNPQQTLRISQRSVAGGTMELGVADLDALARYGTLTIRQEYTVVVRNPEVPSAPLEVPLFVTDAVILGAHMPDELLVSSAVFDSLPKQFIAQPSLFVDGTFVSFSKVRVVDKEIQLPFSMIVDLAHPELTRTRISNVLLTVTAESLKIDTVADELRGMGFTVQQDYAAASVKTDSTPMLLAFSLNITVMAVLTAAVALALLLISSLRMAEERTHDALVLRAFGGTRLLIGMVLLTEALVSGIFGAVLSLTLGRLAVEAAASSVLGTASALFLGGRRGILPDFYSPSVIAVTIGVAVALSLLGAAIPTWQLARRSHRARGSSRSNSGYGWLLPSAFLISSVLSIGAAILAEFLKLKELALLSAVLQILAVALAALFAVGWIAHKISAWLQRGRRVEVVVGAGLLLKGRQTLGRGAAVGAVSIVLIVALSAMVSSFRASLESWAKSNVSADVVVRALLSGAGSEPAALPQGLLQELRNSPGVSCMEQRSHALRRGEFGIVGTDGRCRSYELLAGRQPHAENEVLVNEAAQRLAGVSIGASLSPDGLATSLQVVGVLRDFSPEGPQIFVKLDQFQRVVGSPPTIAAVALYGAEGKDPPTVSEVNQTLKGRGLASGGLELRGLMLSTFDATFLITRFMRWCVACLAVVTISVLFGQWLSETAEERGVFALLGASRFEGLLAILLGASTFVFVIGGLGIAGGYIAARILTDIVNPLSFGWSFPLVFALGDYLLLTAGICLLSLSLGILGRAARLPTQRIEESLV